MDSLKVYFHIRNEWVLLDNETDFINGLPVSMFTNRLSLKNKDDQRDNEHWDYHLDNFIVKVQYNGTKYATDFSHLLFENIED